MMPLNVNSAEFLVGYIQSKMEQMHAIVHRLDDDEGFSQRELERMREEYLTIDLDIQTQSRSVDDKDVEPTMEEYRALYSVTEQKWKVQYAKVDTSKGAIPKNRRASPEIQFGEVDMAEYENDEPVDEPQRRVVDTSMEMYVSDNEEPVPLQYWSYVRTTANFRPIQFARSDELWSASATKQPKLRAKTTRRHIQQSPSTVFSSSESQIDPVYGGRFNRLSTSSQASRQKPKKSVVSYVSSKQEPFSKAVSGRPYPPMLTQLPYSISRTDSRIIGMSEIYVRRPKPAQICPICPGGKHKLFHCTTFERSSLLERWFRALSAGVCLNCLTLGHSSFTCMSPGACTRCQKRHNSLLCPMNPMNR